MLETGLQRSKEEPTAYAIIPGQPHCDTGIAGPKLLKAKVLKGASKFPGGVLARSFGFDLSKMMYGLSQKAQGASSANQNQVVGLSLQGLQLAMGMLQSMLGGIFDIVPPLIPPPIWNNMPLPCLPMLTGHNCFGAVLMPITMADFVMADMTDSQLDGYIAGFPNSYASKVGKTSDTMYKMCFQSFMSMHCSSIFPRCTVPQSRDEPIAFGGRVPMCFHLCVSTLVLCPGFWVSDILGPCSLIGMPPMCTHHFFFNLFLLPPQLTSFSESNGYPKDCPALDTAVGGEDMGQDPALYDETTIGKSPILAAAAGEPVKLPPVQLHEPQRA